MTTQRVRGKTERSWTWRVFKRYALLDNSRIFFAIVARFPPRRDLWCWLHRWPEGIDIRVWPVDLFIKRA
jgi:hypothetical protein